MRYLKFTDEYRRELSLSVVQLRAIADRLEKIQDIPIDGAEAGKEESEIAFDCGWSHKRGIMDLQREVQRLEAMSGRGKVFKSQSD